MDSQKLGFSAMLFSVGCFGAIGLLEYYPLLRFYGWDSMPLEVVHGFLKRFGPLHRPYQNKLFLLLTILGAVMCYYPKKVPGRNVVRGLVLWGSGVILLFLSEFLRFPSTLGYGVSILCYATGFGGSIWGTLHLFQVMHYQSPAQRDPFNQDNETFLQMEERIDTPYSVNIPYDYWYQGTLRKGWVNFVNLFRGLLIVGTPGSGKSFALIEEIIEQFIQKRFTLLLYDFKFDSLSTIAYNYWLREKKDNKANTGKTSAPIPEFYVLNFDAVERSHRCNPLDPYLMKNQMDAADAATVIMKNLNKEWIKRNDFFSRSAISFVSGLIWYLKRKSEEHGKNLCTLPHVITLSTVNIEYLLSIMLEDLEVRSLMIPFKDALEREAGQQLAGQTASAQISLSMLANKEIFYVMTGNDFQLDLNNPEQPKILCIQNNPNRSEIYAAPIGLYINKALQLINRPGCRPCGLILDELPTVFIMGLRKIIDTGRSHLVATVLGIQSISQLIADYGKEMADVIFDNCANVFSGAAKGETARRISEIFGRIHQEKKGQTLSKQDTSTNITTEMMELLPKSKLTGMSTGHFGGIVADTFETPLSQKLCYGLLKPNLASKKIQGEHRIPPFRSFKSAEHAAALAQRLADLDELRFYTHLTAIDWTIRDYYAFYHEHLPTVAQANYRLEIDQLDFCAFVKSLRLFDHAFTIHTMIKTKTEPVTPLRRYIESLVDTTLVQEEKERVLDANFRSILEDIDALVRKEYEKVHGQAPEFGIFDTRKIVSETPKDTETTESTSEEQQYFQMASEQILDKYTGSQEKATFERIIPETRKDLFLFGQRLQASEPFSSYPVEFIEE